MPGSPMSGVENLPPPPPGSSKQKVSPDAPPPPPSSIAEKGEVAAAIANAQVSTVKEEAVQQGDLVEFTLKEERGGGREGGARKLVRRVTLLERGGGLPQERGVILTVKENKFGFIRAEEAEAQVFFHVSELEPALAENPRPGTEVRFVRKSDTRTKKDAAARIVPGPPTNAAPLRRNRDANPITRNVDAIDAYAPPAASRTSSSPNRPAFAPAPPPSEASSRLFAEDS